jgi:hypothetical protein
MTDKTSPTADAYNRMTRTRAKLNEAQKKLNENTRSDFSVMTEPHKELNDAMAEHLESLREYSLMLEKVVEKNAL